MRKIPKSQMSRAEWLKERKKGIGGSDIAAICGYSKHKGPLGIYLDKTDKELPEEKENIAAELGLELEPFLSRKFTKWMMDQEGLEIDLHEMDDILQHDTIDYFLVNLDRWFIHPERGECVVELKTTTEYNKDKWEGDNVPDEYYSQVQWQLLITGFKCGYLVVLVGNRIFDVKLIPRNEEFIKMLAEKGQTFWEEFVVKDVPPAPTGADSDDDALKALYPEEDPGAVIEFSEADTNMIIEAMNEIDIQSAIKKEAEGKVKTSKQIIKWKMENAETASAGNRKITYKTVQVQEKFVDAYSFRKLNIGKEKK